jgi:hypothetical protein
LNVKTTSADVKGVPSEKATPSRSVSVMTRPSAETDHFSASQGSGWSVVRFRRTSGACIRRVSASTAACCALGARRLNVGGSERRDAVSDPPRTGPAGVADVDDADDEGCSRLHAMAATSDAATRKGRSGRAILDLTGQ